MDFELGTLYLEVRIDHSRSLKDKRALLRSLKGRLRSRLNVSVAEVGFQDSLRDSTVVVAAVAASRHGTRRVLDLARREAERVLGPGLVRAVIDA